MDNDPFDMKTYTNLVTNYLYNMNYIGVDKKERLHVALLEMLMNAVEHGNCKISYEEKSAWLEKQGDILPLIRKKCEDPHIRAKKVYFTYRITPKASSFVIRDEGEGFDWKTRFSKANEVNLWLHGHGIKMANLYVQNLKYNDKGNEVSFEMQHDLFANKVIPMAFADQEEVTFQDGEQVFEEGEESSYLYYIVSGKFKIFANQKLISRLGPDDIFIGEMSFLLNNKRSATVVSDGTSVLIKISKNAFVNAIKKYPHYGIFLARLLARRLSNLNERIGKAKIKAKL